MGQTDKQPANGAAKPEANNSLSALEQMLWAQIQQRSGEMAARHELEKQALQRTASDFFRMIEVQHSLLPGAIGTTHDFKDGRVVEMPKPNGPNAPPKTDDLQSESVTT